MPTIGPLRYAHIDGHTEVCFDDSGKHMLTGGTDGEVRVWEGIEDDSAVSHIVGDRVYGILYRDGRFFTSCHTNTVQAHTYPEGLADGILTRFTAPVNHMAFNLSGKTMVACSSDFTIKMVEVDSCKYKTCTGHEAPVLSVALDPKEEFLASSSCDGTVKLWKWDDQSLVTSMAILPKCGDVSLVKSMCRLCWDLKGKVLSVLSLSPDGKFLAVSSSQGDIIVFNMNCKCVDSFKHPKKLSITSLAWNPKKPTELAYCDNEGQLGILQDIKVSPDSQTGVSKAVRAEETRGIFEDDSDDDMLIQATLGGSNNKESMLEDNIDEMPVIEPTEDNDDIESKRSDIDDTASVTSTASLVLPPAPVVVEGYKPTPLQNPFQPGSTPVHLSSRYMVWNSIGIIKQYNTEEENSIDIEFHNTSIHHAMHLSNTNNYTMADMSTEAVVLAAESNEDSPSKLTCMHFGSWDSRKEWTTSMPDEEEIKAVTLGEDWIAVATDKRNVRLFTLGGIQRELFSIPGPVVCLSGHTNQLMVVYHRGMGIPGDQCLGVILMYVEGKQRNILSGEPLPLSAKTALAWIGFSAEGTPFYMESSGIVRMMNRKLGPSWIQVANTKSHAKGKSDHYWVVGAIENPQQLRCIPCKGSRYPPTLPRPAVSLIPFQLPLCEMHVEKSQYEETLWRTKLFNNHFDHWTSQGFDFEPSMKVESSKPMQEALMKLFALSARCEFEYRALDVCEMMTEQHTLQLAIKYASRIKRMHLAERVSELAQRKAEEETQEEDISETIIHTSQTNWTKANSMTRLKGQNQEEVMDEGDDDMNVDEDEDQIDENVEEQTSGPMLNLKPKSGKPSGPPTITPALSSNPFKLSQSSQSRQTKGTAKGTQVFDGLSKKKIEKSKMMSPPVIGKPGKLIVKPKQAVKGNLFARKTKSENTEQDVVSNGKSESSSTPTAFDLWLKENKANIEEEKPDLTEEDLVQIAAERFRCISREEKKIWMQKAKSLKTKDGDADVENKKRKRDEDLDGQELKDTVNKKKKESFLDSKKKLSQNTNSKLSEFAFQKD